jgi:hypothetical protein
MSDDDDDDAVRTSETSVDNHFTRQYIPEDNYEQLLQRFVTDLFNDGEPSLKITYVP